MIDSKTVEEYKKIFILCLEAAGHKTGDKLLLNVEQALNRSVFNELLLNFSKEMTFGDVISTMLTSILVPKLLGISYDSSKDVELDATVLLRIPELIEKVSSEALDLYKNYLEKASIKFCEERGLELSVKFNKHGKKL